MQSEKPKNQTINNRWKKIERENGVYLPTLKKFPIITKNSKVCLIGSCFADDMGWVLAENRIDIGEVNYLPEKKSVGYPWGTFFSPMNIYDLVEIALNQKSSEFFDDNTFIRVPSNLKGNHFEKTSQLKSSENFKLINLFFKARINTQDYNLAKKVIQERLEFFRKSIINADVIIVTLGLIETWIDKNKKKAWHCFHGNPIKKISVDNLAEFKQLNFNEVSVYLKKILDLLESKKKKIIFTISPIPLNFTFTNKDIVIANKYSKSLLRSAVEDFIDDKNIFYFPSFEIVQDCVGWPNSYEQDKRHVRPEIFKNLIAPKFIESFTNFENFEI